MTDSTAAPAAETTTPKKKAEKKAGTRMATAVALAARLTEAQVNALLGAPDPEKTGEQEFASTKARVDRLMSEARALRDFGREIAPLSSVERKMVAAGIAASRP